jgi:hypothetical protein
MREQPVGRLLLMQLTGSLDCSKQINKPFLFVYRSKGSSKSAKLVQFVRGLNDPADVPTA